MARLKKAEKVFIVRSLAQFMEPSLVVEAVKENFKIDVSRQQVECYDPTNLQSLLNALLPKACPTVRSLHRCSSYPSQG